MRAGNAPLQPQLLRLMDQRLDVARQRIVALVAMHVDGETTVGSQAAQELDGPSSVFHRALEMRNAADHVDAAIERAVEVGCGGARAQIAVLGKRDELQVEVRRNALFHFE